MSHYLDEANRTVETMKNKNRRNSKKGSSRIKTEVKKRIRGGRR